MSRAERQALLALGEDFASVWNDPACPMVLKKKIARTLINEIIVELNDATQQLYFITAVQDSLVLAGDPQ